MGIYAVFLVTLLFIVAISIDQTLATKKHLLVQVQGSQEDKKTIETISRIARRSADNSRTAGISWNNVVDVIFTIARRDIVDQGVDTISLPNVHKNFQRKFGFVTVKGIFLAEHGKLSNISTVERSEDVSVVKEGFKWKMVCVLSFKELKVRYDHYSMNVTGLSLKGAIEGTVSSNSVSITLIFENTPSGCVSSLEDVKVVSMEGLHVNVTGLGPFNFLGSAMAKWAVEQKRGDIVKTIEHVLAREARKALSVFQCDEYASLLML